MVKSRKKKENVNNKEKKKKERKGGKKETHKNKYPSLFHKNSNHT